MVDYFFHLNYLLLALYAGIFTWFITLLGALLVYFFRNVSSMIMDLMLALSAGVMISASFFSLLLPAINLADKNWLLPSMGLFVGGIIICFGDIIFNKRFNNNLKTNFLLIFSITLHNIPEGLAIGIAFGSLKYGLDNASLVSALMLALGIGIQNFPEGAAVSLPLKRSGMNIHKSFFMGQLSGLVEPISALIGAYLALKIKIILPFILALAAGAMIYVVIKELIPESQKSQNKNIVAIFTMLGFMIMMILDVAFG